MDFDVVQTSGPQLLEVPAAFVREPRGRWFFAKRGVYKFRAADVQSSEEQGLQTLGADNGLALTVVVR